jgi:hypothetical protein
MRVLKINGTMLIKQHAKCHLKTHIPNILLLKKLYHLINNIVFNNRKWPLHLGPDSKYLLTEIVIYPKVKKPKQRAL